MFFQVQIHKLIVYILYTIYIIITGLMMYFFYRKSHLHPIKKRNPSLVLLMNFLIILSIIGEIMDNRSIKCIYYIILFIVGTNASLFVYMIRSWILLFKLGLARNIAVYNEFNISGWYIRNRRFISLKFIIFVSFIFSLLNLIIILRLSNIPCKNVNSSIVVVNFTNCILGIFMMCFIIFKSTKYKDDLYDIKKEILYIGFTTSITTILYFIISTISLSRDINYYLYYIFRIITISIVTSISLIYPIKKSYKVVERDIEISLSNYLENKDNFDLFILFLGREFSSENLLFWRAVNIFNKEPNHKKKKLFKIIMKKYILDNSYLQINISSIARKKLENAFDITELDSEENEIINFNSIFNESQREIYSLMSLDSFPRFLKLQNIGKNTIEKDSFVDISKNNIKSKFTSILPKSYNYSIKEEPVNI